MFVKCYSEDNPARQKERAARNVALANQIVQKLESLGVTNDEVLRLGVDLSDIIVDTEIIKELVKDLIKIAPSDSDAWYQTISDLLGWAENLKTHFSNAIMGLTLLREYSDTIIPPDDG